MEEWQLRVYNERDELNEKIVKLTGFLCSGGSKHVVGIDLMREQLRHMLDYSDTLTKRIDQF